ncbi:MFS transporter [Amycolatopsis sp. NPDC005232]|uniref:MFS transporter n=1 Tax=Amycolatopsis sp. NPDC005232 TaxID=3157027 RepID=UPI0033B71E41
MNAANVRTRTAVPFRRFWWSAVVSGTGDGIRLVALPLFAAALTRQPAAVAIVTFAGGLPWLLVGPFTGALTDRWTDHRRVLWATDVTSAIVIGAAGLLAVAGAGAIPLLAAVNFALCAVQTLRDNAAVAIVPRLVARNRLETANSRMQAAQLLTVQLAGPPLGAALFILPTGVPFLLDAASFVVSAVLVLSITSTTVAVASPVSAAVARAGIFGEIREGLRWLWRHRLLRSVCLMVGMVNIAVTGALAIAVLYAYEVLHIGRLAYGVLLAVIALGGLVGTLAAPALTTRFSRGRVLRTVFAAAPVAFTVAGLTTDYLVATLSLAMVGAAIGVTNVVSISLRQLLVPAGLLGRVNAAYRFFAFGMAPLGAALSAVAAEAWGLSAPFLLGAVVLAGAWLLSVRGLRTAVVDHYLPAENSVQGEEA